MGSTIKPKPKKKTELNAIDWVAMKPEYETGLKSNRTLAKQFGCSHVAIANHVREFGWTKRLKDQIHARSEELLTSGAIGGVTTSLTSFPEKEVKPGHDERLTIEANARALAIVKLAHRDDIATLRGLVRALLLELGEVQERPELFALVHDALAHPDEIAMDDLRQMAEFVRSLPARTKVAKDLADALFKVIGMEREAHGLNTAGGTDGLPMVIVKDYTGRGDPDAPEKPPSEYE